MSDPTKREATDEEVAREIRARVRDLNLIIRGAAARGIECEFEMIETRSHHTGIRETNVLVRVRKALP